MTILVYFIVCLFCFSLITWAMVRSIIRRDGFPPNNDDDGGMPGGNDFPIIGLPPGGKVEDLLVDRWHDDVVSPSSKPSF
jgi:hypothetical protein